MVVGAKSLSEGQKLEFTGVGPSKRIRKDKKCLVDELLPHLLPVRRSYVAAALVPNIVGRVGPVA